MDLKLLLFSSHFIPFSIWRCAKSTVNLGSSSKLWYPEFLLTLSYIGITDWWIAHVIGLGFQPSAIPFSSAQADVSWPECFTRSHFISRNYQIPWEEPIMNNKQAPITERISRIRDFSPKGWGNTLDLFGWRQVHYTPSRITVLSWCTGLHK